MNFWTARFCPQVVGRRILLDRCQGRNVVKFLHLVWGPFIVRYLDYHVPIFKKTNWNCSHRQSQWCRHYPDCTLRHFLLCRPCYRKKKTTKSSIRLEMVRFTWSLMPCYWCLIFILKWLSKWCLCVCFIGAYGTVYKGRDLVNKGKFVAMKKIKIPLAQDGVPMTTLREIALLKQLDQQENPNIVKYEIYWS